MDSICSTCAYLTYDEDYEEYICDCQMDEDDLDFIMEALQSTYWETKRYNRRFVNKRYQKDSDNS